MGPSNWFFGAVKTPCDLPRQSESADPVERERAIKELRASGERHDLHMTANRALDRIRAAGADVAYGATPNQVILKAQSMGLVDDSGGTPSIAGVPPVDTWFDAAVTYIVDAKHASVGGEGGRKKAIEDLEHAIKLLGRTHANLSGLNAGMPGYLTVRVRYDEAGAIDIAQDEVTHGRQA